MKEQHTSAGSVAINMMPNNMIFVVFITHALHREGWADSSRTIPTDKRATLFSAVKVSKMPTEVPWGFETSRVLAKRAAPPANAAVSSYSDRSHAQIPSRRIGEVEYFW